MTPLPFIFIRMKRTYYILLIIILYFLCNTLAMAEEKLQFQIIGVTGDLLSNVNARLAVEKSTYDNHLDTAAIHKIYTHTMAVTNSALQPYGYFRAKINTQLLRAAAGWTIKVQINPGQALRVTAIDLQLQGEGRDDAPLRAWLKNFPLQRGAIFNTAIYEKAKLNLFQTANNEGYIKANLTENKILIDLKNDHATIIMHFDTGERYYFGDVTFSPNPYADSFLQRFITFKPD